MLTNQKKKIFIYLIFKIWRYLYILCIWRYIYIKHIFVYLNTPYILFVCALSPFSHVRLSAAPLTVGHQAPLWETESGSRSVVFDFCVTTPWIMHARLLCPWNSPGKNTGLGIAIPFSRGSCQPRDQTQGSNLGLLHCRQILYHLSHQRSPRNKSK